jgi:hypothetical protein
MSVTSTVVDRAETRFVEAAARLRQYVGCFWVITSGARCQDSDRAGRQYVDFHRAATRPVIRVVSARAAGPARRAALCFAGDLGWCAASSRGRHS